jgi:hypothetical protein
MKKEILYCLFMIPLAMIVLPFVLGYLLLQLIFLEEPHKIT